MATFPATGILIETETFDDFGGWVLDSQFEMEMGSPYLLAHGNGRPVRDASTTIRVPLPDRGQYKVWVRTKDWVPGHHPGRFQLLVDDSVVGGELCANDCDWSWEFAGNVELPPGEVSITLRDLTGFGGRCAAIFLTEDDVTPPEFRVPIQDTQRAWRRTFRKLPRDPVIGGSFDLIVAGGGFVGACAAITAARLGERVALIQDRPYLGGNASVEVGLSPRGVRGPLVEELVQRLPNGDLNAKQLLDAEPNAEVFIEHTIYDAAISNGNIVSVDVRQARTGKESRFYASRFIDCSGKCILGLLVGAETLSGREPAAMYGESLAPRRGDDMHHGNTLFFRTIMRDTPVPFPDVPWATEIAKDYSNLGGQLIETGRENGPGPVVFSQAHTRNPNVPTRMQKPMTHYWEYGQWLDLYTQGEHIRDYLLRAVYGTFSNVKRLEPETYANLAFDHVAFVAGQGEFRRYRGDYVLCEPDVRTRKQFGDAVAPNGAAFCLHYPGHSKYDFRLQHWIWDEAASDYDVPFRSLYSCNIHNLMMAGKHISVTHVVGSSTKLMGNGSQHAIATAAAAHLCHKYGKTPREIGKQYMNELQTLIRVLNGSDSKMPKSRL